MKKNRRRGSRPIDRLARALRAAIAGLVVPALLLGAAAGVARWAVHHPYFQLRTVAVEGARDPEAVVGWAQIRHDVSLWSIDPESTELRLLAHPRIRSASVRREFPDRLRVKVEERLPLAVVLLDDPLFVDAEGRVFEPLARELLGDYPYVSGLRAADLEKRPAWVAMRLRGAARILRLWQRHPDWPAVSEVRPQADGEFVVYPEQSPMAVRFGTEIDDEPFARLSAVLELWRGREMQVAAVDLTVPGQAVLRLRAGVKSPERRMTI